MISAPTVRRRLKERGLSAKTPATGPRLTVGLRKARLEFAQQYVNRGDNEWKNVLFTDESRFNPRSPTVVRRCGEDQGSDTVNAAYLPEVDIMEAVL
jgi:hypothetical protein